MSLSSAILLLFLVMDPLSNIPFFITALAPVEPARHTRVVVRELLIAYGVMVAFLFLGRPLLAMLGISGPALTIAGGVILFLISIRMVFPPTEGSAGEAVAGEPFIVPLAIPYVAGPSLLATELLLMNREPARWGEWWIALTVAWAGTSAILLLGSRLRKRLGARGMIAIERLMGMILVAIAVQMFLTGVSEYRSGRPAGVATAAHRCAGAFAGDGGSAPGGAPTPCASRIPCAPGVDAGGDSPDRGGARFAGRIVSR
jgi:small neutral amino acid transporter SnatA (MarC family)